MQFEEVVRRTSRGGGLEHAALGLAAESGEFANLVKKAKFQGSGIDIPSMIRELGDIEWYLEYACQCLGITRGEIQSVCEEKLRDRHPECFADKSSPLN